jgi:ribosomal protein S18 acetylase RimI-like enzyme
MEIIYRQARKKDCKKLGLLTSIAGDGLLEYMLDGVVPGMSAVEVAAYDLADNKGPKSYRNVIVAEAKNKVKGMAFSYHSRHHCIDQDLRDLIPWERLQPLQPLFSARVEDSLYLDTLAVDEDLRGQGVGGKLIDLTKQKARENEFNSLSLIVSAENESAMSVYRKLGFKGVQEIPMDGLKTMSGNDALLLMECKLSAG